MRVSLVVVTVAALVAQSACAPRETSEQRVTRIRRQFRVQPNGFQPRSAADGTPELMVSLLVVNQGREGLSNLTLRVHVQGLDGEDRASALVTVDTSALVPGVSSQLTAIARGLEVAADETVLIELEDAPLANALESYPEYGDPTAGTARSGSAVS